MSNPKLIPVPFADDGTYTNISTNRGSGDALEQPNYSDGFPAITSTPLAAGGKAPRREDFNGLLHDLSENISHLNKGGFFMFDVDFCAQIGGYPKGSVLLSNDKTKKYTSLIDNNTSNFNVSVDPAKWVQSGLTETEVKAIAWGDGQTSAPWVAKTDLRAQKFEVNGSFKVPEGVATIYVSAAAGGGGGGGGAGTSGQSSSVGGGGGGGGGAGQQIIKQAYSVTPGQTIPITIGAGGAAGIGNAPSPGSSGGNGGNTVIGSLVSLIGGGGGGLGGWVTSNAIAGGGSGAVCASGYPRGSHGGDGSYEGNGGAGASSAFGGGGGSGRAGVPNGAGGYGAGGYGAGGGGGGGGYGTSPGNGGNGGSGSAGFALIEW